jgi:5-methylcytosine-specific restriction endonuclease McrA
VARRPEVSDYYGGPPAERAMSSLRRSSQARRVVHRQLLELYGAMCWRCGEPIEGEAGEIGHRIAAARGGTDELANLGLEHRLCNNRAGAGPVRARIVDPPR